MCLGVPGKVVAVEDYVATVEFWGVRRQIRLELCDEPVAPGDYVLNHVGFAIRRIPEEDIGETLALYQSLLEEAGAEDLMAADIQGEMEATEAATASRRAAGAEPSPPGPLSHPPSRPSGRGGTPSLFDSRTSCGGSPSPGGREGGWERGLGGEGSGEAGSQASETGPVCLWPGGLRR